MPANVHFDFTTQAPPALPTGCVDTHGTVVTVAVTLGGAATVAAHGTVLPGPDSIATYSSGIPDGSGGLTKTVATFGTTSLTADVFQGLLLAWRSSVADDPTTGTAYGLVLEMGGGPQITWRKYVSGTATDIGVPASPVTWTAGHLYRITIDHTGAGDPTFTLFDLTGALYWNGAAWQAGATNFTVSGTDSSITAQGYNAASFYGASAAVHTTDYQVILPGPTQATLSGPTTGTTGVESTPFTATLDVAAPTGGTTVNLASDGAGDVFHATAGGPAVATITIPSGSTAGTFLLVPGTAGARHVSISSAGLTVVGSPITYTSSNPPPATAITLSCPATVTIGTPATLTATANGAVSVNHVLTIADTSGLTIGPITIPAGQLTGTASFTEATAGTWALSGVDGGALPVTGCSYTASVLVALTLAADLTADFSGHAATLKVQVYTTDGTGTVLIAWAARGTAGVTCFETATPGGYVIGFTAPPGTYAVVIDPDGTGTAANFTGPVLVASAQGTAGAARLPADGLDAVAIEAGINARQALSLMLAALAGKVGGADTDTITFQGGGVTQTRIVAGTDAAGNRTTVTLTPPA